MTTEPTAVEQANELLGLEGPIELSALLDSLAEFRIQNHPDKFTTEDGRKLATEKFKVAGNILHRLQVHQEEERFSVRPVSALARTDNPGNALALVGSAFSTAKVQLAIQLGKELELRGDIENASATISILEDKNKKLEERLKKRRRKRLNIARTKVINKYRGARRSIVTVGFSAAIVVLYAILLQVENLAKRVLAPLGLSPDLAGWILFGVFASVLVVAIHRYVRAQFVAGAIEDLCVTAAMRRFAAKLREQGKETEFLDGDALSFVELELRPKSATHRVLSHARLRHFGANETDDVKNVFLAHMLDNELIEAGPVNDLEHVFRIRKRERYPSWNGFEDLLDEYDDLEDSGDN